ncbi:MAG: Flp family type IVb pilin [Gammaproteobacteria bacterium]
MVSLKERAIGFLCEDQGLTMVEYAVAGGLIGAAVVAAFIALGGSVAGIVNYVDQQLGLSPGA